MNYYTYKCYDKYDEIATEIFDNMLQYKVKNESLGEVIEKTINNHGNYSYEEKIKIETRIIHVMSIKGYDIDCIKPFKLKKYRD